MVPGVRPDIEVLYPLYPQVNKAAWGYLLLTSMLPHVPNQQMLGGQGPLTLSVLAEDMEGHQRWLGRNFAPFPTDSDQVPTTITLANDTIAKPFGTIDSPAQGATVSGAFYNFEWTLTPDSNTTPDAGDILMPVNGATQIVYIDGLPMGPLTYYNLCRGNVGSPVAAGVYCNDDVANIFGNPTPQPVLTPRTSNPTKHRNLDAGRGAIGAYWLDTTTLSNGLHTIAWGATDSAGRDEGIGSRYFTVLNGAGDARAGRDESRGDARVLDALQPALGDVWGRTGFDVAAPYAEVAADEAGVRHVEIPDLGRLELWLGEVERGYLVANGTLRDLPLGSRLDPATGQFTWAPGVGYHGTYRLAFVRGSERVTVEVTIRPLQPATAGAPKSRPASDDKGTATRTSDRQPSRVGALTRRR